MFNQTGVDENSHLQMDELLEEFPQDGGYSGALILEKCESAAGSAGKDNSVYQAIYNTSLSDMPKAYRKISMK